MSTEPAILDIPKNPAVRRAWVCYQLRLRGTSLRRIAQQHNVSPQAVSAALMTPSSHIEQAIAAALDLTPEQLFPERFDAVGHRLTHTRLPNRSTAAPGCNVQSGQTP
jgi:lambda repressor-like predicted transcriptional regulator